jgi:hypothetical protein
MQAESERKVIFGGEVCKKKKSWKEEKHTCIHGRPNDARVRVFVIHCNGW